MTEVTDLTAQLVRIDSVNPALDPSGGGETAIARFVTGWAHDRGLTTQRLEPVPGRPSVIVTAPGQGGGPTLLLNAHLDTVGVHGMGAPFTPRIEAGRMHGRGTMDMKAGLAACLLALSAVVNDRLRGDVVLAAVADEEHDSIGTRAALSAVPDPALCVVTEPTDLSLHTAHRGFCVVEVTFEGRASHTSQPEQGVNALTHLGRLLDRVEQEDRRFRTHPAHPLLGHGSWQPVLASGGRELFTTPDAAVATVERRTLPGETARHVLDEVDAWLRALRADDPTVRATVRTEVAREAFEAGPDDLAVTAAADAVRAETGRTPDRRGAPYWTDAALIADAGVPTVLFGPVGGGIHQPNEWVDLASVEVVRAVLTRLARTVCA